MYENVLLAAETKIPDRAKPFLFVTARNLLINRLQKESIVAMEVVADLDALGAAADEPGPDRSAFARDMLRRLQAALDSPPAEMPRGRGSETDRRAIAARDRAAHGNFRTIRRQSCGARHRRSGRDGLRPNGRSTERPMSQTDMPDIAPSRRSEIRAEAAEWFARAHSGAWGTADQEQLDAWLGQSLSHEAAYWRLEGAWMEAARLTVLRASAEAQNSTARRIIPVPIKIAMAIVFAAVIGLTGYSHLSGPPMEKFATPVGGHRMLALSDGSQIELDTDTVVRVAMKADRRTVWLDRGEAYFRVNHNAARPFAVMAGDHRIIDLGTKFLVKQSESRVEVTLLEGRARLEAGGGLLPVRSIELSPGDVATASANSMAVIKKPARILANELGWRRGVLVFEGTSLADAAAQMNRYNTQQIVIADSSIARRAIDGTFPVHAVPQFTEMAQAIFGFRVEKKGNQTLISR